MDLIKSNSLPDTIVQEFKKSIRDLHVSLEINVINKNKSLKLCDPEFFRGCKVKIPIENDIDPSTDNAQISGKLASRGILSFEVQDKDRKPNYLIITWAVKTAMKRGRNSVAITIRDKKLEKENSRHSYKMLHIKQNRKYPGDYINPDNIHYRISGGITDG
ncbi:17252_t:CDS:2 [Acaulospora morrowiae]|uniref:17252_t:CDS:1 n=1 Tax=Acaulospora morrowiae TaxID=94023 RepID=A0A9N9E4Z2_9GLOM|nr:17252_t:CDS:2 [Acaulospora morrowiae]